MGQTKVPQRGAKVLFITGTSTGVGKTVATALLLYYLRQAGRDALGIKPFCCGGREDAEKLEQIQGSALPANEVNPFYFKAPLAPLAAQQLEDHPRVTLRQALRSIQAVLPRCDRLLVEGCGGLLVPLGENFSFLDMILQIGGDVLVVAPDQLGVLNHVLLTLNALPPAFRDKAKILLMGQPKADLSSQTNAGMLRQLISPRCVFTLPFLGCNPLTPRRLKLISQKHKKILAGLLP